MAKLWRRAAARRRREFSVAEGSGHCGPEQWGFRSKPATAAERRGKARQNSEVRVAGLAPRRRIAAKKTFVSVSLEPLVNSGIGKFTGTLKSAGNG